MAECVGVKFDNGPKLHYVEAPSHVPSVNQICVVSTRRGLELATIRTGRCDNSRPSGYFVREAFEDDLEAYEKLKDKAEELKWLLRALVRHDRLEVKIVRLEFNLEETLLVVHYSAKVMLDLRPFIRDLMHYTPARIEFHNVGPRDEARMLGALGMCGTGSCSSTWLQGFAAVGIRMAREQQLPLNPDKISGPCGRLMCCLQYEHEMYLELLDEMPRRGSKACHEHSGTCGRIVKLNPLKQSVEIENERGLHEFPLKEVKTFDEAEDITFEAPRQNLHEDEDLHDEAEAQPTTLSDFSTLDLSQVDELNFEPSTDFDETLPSDLEEFDEELDDIEDANHEDGDDETKDA